MKKYKWAEGWNLERFVRTVEQEMGEWTDKYCGPHGKCVIGCFIGDHEYTEDIEGMTWPQVLADKQILMDAEMPLGEEAMDKLQEVNDDLKMSALRENERVDEFIHWIELNVETSVKDRAFMLLRDIEDDIGNCQMGLLRAMRETASRVAINYEDEQAVAEAALSKMLGRIQE